MVALIISIIFWLVGILIIFGGEYFVFKIKHAQHDLRKSKESLEFNDNSASIVRGIEAKALDYIPWYLIRIAASIVGLIVIAFGFVALGFVFR
ncbi:hypothetical protein [Scopulibacillus cellulosilyticus]|uniref:DUF3899 domain-containing protein n=1 Tax=Scopulibacillus cellulosilyticus TaxID=2665665 RepID=A0ABW2PXV3_9BACL